MSDDRDSVIRNLAEALTESLIWGFVEGKEPPYRVPFAIQGDLWKWSMAEDKGRAYRIIKKAVERASGFQPAASGSS